MARLLDQANQILTEKQTKLVPENIRKGIKIFDIEGVLDANGASTGPVAKIFTSAEEMQTDATAVEGDVATVYESKLVDVEKGRKLDTGTVLYFKDVVVFDAVPANRTGSFYCGDYRYSLTLTSTAFTMTKGLSSGSSSNATTICEYTSSDGLTYTRTTEQESEIMIFDSATSFSYAELAKFFQREDGVYNGLYRYETGVDKNQLVAYVNPTCSYVLTSVNFTYTEKTQMNVEKLREYILSHSDVYAASKDFLVLTEDEIVFDLYYHDVTTSTTMKKACGVLSYDTVKYITANRSYATSCGTFHKITIDLSTNTHTVISAEPTIYTYMNVFETFSTTAKMTTIYFDSSDDGLYVFAKNTGTTASNSKYKQIKSTPITVTKYFSLPNQFTLSTPDQIVENVVAMGKTDVITGDGSIINTFDNYIFYEGVYQENIVKLNGLYALPTYRKNNILLSIDYLDNDKRIRYANLLSYNGDISTAGLRCKYYTEGVVSLDGKYDVVAEYRSKVIVIRSTETEEILYTYPIDELASVTDDVSKYVHVCNNKAYVLGDTNSIGFCYIINLETGVLTKRITDYSEEHITYYSQYCFGVDATNNRLYISECITYSNVLTKIIVGYIDLATDVYTELYSKEITTTEVYSNNYVRAMLTTNHQILVAVDYKDSSSTHHLFIFLDVDGTVIKSYDTTSYNGSLSSNADEISQKILYDDGTNLYYDTYCYPKDTLVYSSVESSIWPTRCSFDFVTASRTKDDITYCYELSTMTLIASYEGITNLAPHGYASKAYLLFKRGEEYIMCDSYGMMHDCTLVTVEETETCNDSRYMLTMCLVGKTSNSNQYTLSLTPHALNEAEELLASI